MVRVGARQTIADLIKRYADWAPVFLRQHLDLDKLGELALGNTCTFRNHIAAELERLIAAGRQLTPAGSFEWELATNVVRWSDALSRIYGFHPGAFPGTVEAFLERVHPDDRERTMRLVAEVFENPRGLTYEHRIITLDGQIRLLFSRVDLIKDRDGHPLRMIGSSWDVTELRTIDQDIEGSPWLLRATLDATADGLLVVDRVGNIKMFNERFLELWRIPVELREQRSDAALLEIALVQIADPDTFLHHVHELYANPGAESFDVLRFLDGRVYERYSRPSRVVDAIVGRVWSFRDVTERERLLARQTFLVDASRLLSSLDIESALEALAHTALPYLGQACAIDLWVDGKPRRLVSHALAPEYEVPAETPTRPDCVPIVHEYKGKALLAIPLQVRERVIGVMAFVSAGVVYDHADLEIASELCHRISLMLENERLFEELKAALRSRDEFLSIAAHEIRGPLTSIHLGVQMLTEQGVTDAKRDELLKLIAREDRQLARFVDDLVDLTRIRTGRLRLELADVDLGDVVREVVTRLATDLERAGSKLTVQTEQVPVIGKWDRVRVDQIVTNLVTNAIKFGLGKPIEVAVVARGGTATLTVTDQGIGVAPDQRERIFEPFERGVSVQHYGGLGLGLFITRTIVTRLGGTVHVEPNPGGGCRFIVELPQARNHDVKH
ncbi:MAG: Sensory box histidine kinase [Myxococcales bacterium]|nr:Sensory box histidine kinase [Myxococcales bacterium]